MDMDAIAIAGFEVHGVFLDDDPDSCEFELEQEWPIGAGWQLVALVAHMDGGTNALWVRAAGAKDGA